jgi:hypothetical protein
MKELAERVQIILPEIPCFGCTIPLERYGEAVGFSDPCNGVTDAKIPSFSTVSALTDPIQADEAMKIISTSVSVLINPCNHPVWVF